MYKIITIYIINNMFILNIVLFLFFVFCFSQWLVSHTMVHHLEDLPEDNELDSVEYDTSNLDDCNCVCSPKCCDCDKELSDSDTTELKDINKEEVLI